LGDFRSLEILRGDMEDLLGLDDEDSVTSKDFSEVFPVREGISDREDVNRQILFFGLAPLLVRE